MADDIELTIVTMRFDAADAGGLLGVLSKYVVLTRMEPSCRNVDLCASVTTPGRYLLIQKWDSPTAQRAHFDSADMVEMAESCRGLLCRAAPHRPAGTGRARTTWPDGHPATRIGLNLLIRGVDPRPARSSRGWGPTDV